MKSHPGEKTGAAIRKLRLAKGWTLAELSSQTGIPLSTLSRVELGQNPLNYDKLMRLCRALGVDLQGLVNDQADRAVMISGRRAVIRAGEGAAAMIGGNMARRLASELLAKAFSPAVIEVAAPSLEVHGPFVQIEGEAYLMVLNGPVIFHSHLYAPLPLGKGDSVYFDGRSGYALVAPSGAGKALLIATGEQSFED